MRRDGAALLLMTASGFAGLGYQIVWTQQCGVWLGHEAAAILAVVAAFFGGLAVGSFALGGRIERSDRAGVWYAGCELVVALWGVVLLAALPRWGAAMVGLVGAEPSPLRQWSIAFAATFLLLVPATAAMGATLPAMARVTSMGRNGARSIAGLYAANTAGAVAGVLATAFWLVPSLGFARTAILCVALNVLCALLALGLYRQRQPPAPLGDPHGPLARSPLLARLALTGLLGIGYEVLVVRVLSQVTENTVYTFALLLAVYLVGTALGASLYLRVHRRSHVTVGDRLLLAVAAACLLGTATLWAAARIGAATRTVLGDGTAAALAGEAVLAALAFGPPTVAMGALFSHLADSAANAGIGLGRALGANTAGAALAPALFGVFAVTTVGPEVALLCVVTGYLALRTRRGWARPEAGLLLAAAIGIAVLAPPLAFIEVPEGGRIVERREGVLGAVSVVEDGDGVRRLHINNRQQEGTSATLRVDGRQAWLPLLLHPAPERVLFLGLGTGVTAASAALDRRIDVQAVELLPEVIAASAHFLPALADDGTPPPALHQIAADARRFVRATGERFDVIVSDNFHPARSGSGSLYTVEHFEAVRARLAPGGLFCQWLPLHQMDLETLRSIVRSFMAVNPEAWALVASNSLETPVVGLVARADGGRLDAARLRARTGDAALPARVARLGLEDEMAVLGSFIAGPAALRRFAGDAPVNTDDLPVVTYRAPRITYSQDGHPGDRLIALLQQVHVSPEELLVDVPEPVWQRRLAAYWLARDRFVEAGRHISPSADARAMLSRVRTPLLAVLGISPDFRPAYDPLLALATALLPIDPDGAHALLAELARLQPARTEAAALLSQIGSPISGRPPSH